MFRQNIIIIIILGALLILVVAGVLLSRTQKTVGQPHSRTTSSGFSVFKSNFSDISLLYPSDFFATESGETITISPLLPKDPRMQSSVGIASNLTITFRRNEQLSNSAIRTQHGTTDFHEEETIYKGFKAIIQTYKGDYAGEKNYISLIQYHDSYIGSGIFYIHYAEVNKNVYENILNSLIFASTQ